MLLRMMGRKFARNSELERKDSFESQGWSWVPEAHTYNPSYLRRLWF
jgi:hypothetical protein